MKNRSLALITLLLIPFFCNAQNPMFKGWGKSKEVVLNSISKIPEVKIYNKPTGLYLLASYKKSNFSYTFNKSSLYEVVMEKSFTSKKSADQSFDNCLAYFGTIRAQLVAKSDEEKDLSEYVFASQGKVYWLSLKTHSRKNSKISLIQRDLTETPLELWSELEHKVASEIGVRDASLALPIANAMDVVQD
ncbi:MAG: hypothetical protein MRZ79_08160 [Bacteroidia bacterium]|nr:hypothetical protein [Bacteroidia bacterium]